MPSPLNRHDPECSAKLTISWHTCKQIILQLCAKYKRLTRFALVVFQQCFLVSTLPIFFSFFFIPIKQNTQPFLNAANFLTFFLSLFFLPNKQNTQPLLNEAKFLTFFLSFFFLPNKQNTQLLLNAAKFLTFFSFFPLPINTKHSAITQSTHLK